MCERNFARGSDSTTAKYHEESCNGRRNETHEGSRSLLFVLCIIVTLMTLHRSSAEDKEKCKPRCWNKAPSQDMTFNDGLLRQEIGSEMACKSICYNNETCIGAYWGFDPDLNELSCWLQMPSQGVANTLIKANHWVFTSCTDDCLPYCWRPKLEYVKTQGGVNNSAARTEDRCKETCATGQMCEGVDWSEPTKSCSLLYRHRRTLDPVQHWEIVRNLPTNCSKAEEQCMPHCWTKTVSRQLTFDDGVFTKRIDNEKNCKDVCASNQTCIGVYWGFNTVLNMSICWLQMPFNAVSESLTNVNHWSLSKCTDDCLPYCWLPKWEYIQLLGGIYQYGIEDENWCKVTCTYDKTCTGVDFNRTEKTCWLAHDEQLIQSPTPDPIDHWELDRNLPMVCSNASSEAASKPAISQNISAEDKTTGAAIANSATSDSTNASVALANAMVSEATTAESTTEIAITNATTTEATLTENVTNENAIVNPELCSLRCWKKFLSEAISFIDGIYRNEIDSEQDCKDICANNETCIGIYWGFSLSLNVVSCWFQVVSNGSNDSLDNANYWILSNCTDDCYSFCWKPKWENVETLGGTRISTAQTEDQCKLKCVKDELCDGVDWNVVEQSCWFLFTHRRSRSPIQHWEIVRDLQTNCSKREEQCMPHCWFNTQSHEIIFKDGVLKDGIDNENNCKDICASNQTCIGVYWGLNPTSNTNSCFLQMPFEVVSQTLTNTNHWSLSNCTDDCLPYCWLPKWEFIHSLGGAAQTGVNEENWCKVTCAYDKKCTGVDFNSDDTTCFLLDDIQLIKSQTTDRVNHWELDRNFPMVCSNEPSLVRVLSAEANVTVAEKNRSTATTRTRLGAQVAENVLGHRRTISSISQCPHAFTVIITLTALMGVCVLIIIILLAILSSRTVKDEDKGGKPLSSRDNATRRRN